MKRKTKKEEITTNIPIEVSPSTGSTFHLDFPLCLIHKDGMATKNCYFKDEIDLKKYIKRYKLKPKAYSISQTQPRL